MILVVVNQNALLIISQIELIILVFHNWLEFALF